MSKDYHNDTVDITDEMVDISSGKAEVSSSAKNKHAQTSEKPYAVKKNEEQKKSDLSHFDKSNNKEISPSDAAKKKKKKIIIISSVAAAVVVIALGITGFCLMQNGGLKSLTEDPAKEFTFDEGTVVSGISIGGKTMEQAKALLEESEKSFIKPVSITVDANGATTTLTQDNFEYTYDIDAVLGSIKTEATDPTAKNTRETKTYTITATYTADSVKNNSDAIAKTVDKDAKNASVSKFNPYSDNRFEYKDAEKGYKLDADNLTQQLTQVLDSGNNQSTVKATVSETEAKISVDDIKKNVVSLASYETTSYNTANGTSNMKVSLEACNGSVIDPGETWSFNECTGDSNLESNGYKAAHVISDGKLIDGIGGGICQSSSTIYNAAIRANMEVEERSNHKWASSYVPTGLDATIDYPNLDLKLSNPTDYQMFMECKVVGSTLYVTIWGAKDGSYDTIKTDNELTSKGSSSYTVKAWRVYIKDGKEVDRESLGSSTYDDDYGYVFINADNDSNDDVSYPEESSSKAESSSSSKTQNTGSGGSSGSSSSSSAVVSKPQETQAVTQAPVETKPVETTPAEPGDDTEE